jgi:hypothetical protein
MASELRVNTLKDASGNNSVATSVVAKGSTKAWSKLDGTGTISFFDSYNHSSVTDNGTGDYTHTLTSAMTDGNYSHTFTARTYFAVLRDGNIPTTTTYRVAHIYNDGAGGNFGYSDGKYISTNITGDLA